VDSTGMLASVKNPNQEQIRFCYSKDTEVYVVYRRWINSQNSVRELNSRTALQMVNSYRKYYWSRDTQQCIPTKVRNHYFPLLSE